MRSLGHKRRTQRALVLLTLIGAMPSTLFSQGKETKVYPERGTVIALREDSRSTNLGVHTDAWGRTHGGQSIRYTVAIWRVETDTKVYELEGKGLEVGQVLEFRIEKQYAYVRDAKGKERRYKVVSLELKPRETKKP